MLLPMRSGDRPEAGNTLQGWPVGRPRAAALLLALLCLPTCERHVEGDALQLFAASSLTELIHAVASTWETDTGQPVRVSLAASSTLARQIEQGAPADLFMSADERWVSGLEQGGAAPATDGAPSPVLARQPWLTNRLALVVRVGDRDPDPTALESLVLGGEGVPVGRYARAALSRLGWPLPPRVVQADHARDVLAKLAEGAAQAAIVYRTDVAFDSRVRLVQLLPIDSHPPIVYEVALLREAGRPLYESLRSPSMARLVADAGFDLLP